MYSGQEHLRNIFSAGTTFFFNTAHSCGSNWWATHTDSLHPQPSIALCSWFRFLRINTSSQGFHAVIMSDCVGCTVRSNFVEQSGGDALNFNAGNAVVICACHPPLKDLQDKSEQCLFSSGLCEPNDREVIV
jgi:hypothetical protein